MALYRKPASTHSLEAYPDAGQISGYAQEAMAWANENGIVSGYIDGRLNPSGNATRAQITQMLKNVCAEGLK